MNVAARSLTITRSALPSPFTSAWMCVSVPIFWKRSSPATFLNADLVGAICDCTIDPTLWSVTLGEIATELTLANSVMLTPSIVEPELPSDALQLLYDLTPAETRVLLLIASGMEQTTVAMTLAVSQATVKTHPQHVFDKTGCRRQPELMRLVSSLSAPA